MEDVITQKSRKNEKRLKFLSRDHPSLYTSYFIHILYLSIYTILIN